MGLEPKAPSSSSSPPCSPSPSLPTVRQPRLRASCDGCFLAKVKCSKARPVCSRCLTVGLICHYSPSSRSPLGPKQHKQRGQQQQQHQHSRGAQEDEHRDKTQSRQSGQKTKVAKPKKADTAVLASTMSEESCVWLAQGAGAGGWWGDVYAHHDGTSMPGETNVVPWIGWNRGWWPQQQGYPQQAQEQFGLAVPSPTTAYTSTRVSEMNVPDLTNCWYSLWDPQGWDPTWTFDDLGTDTGGIAPMAGTSLGY